MRNRTLNLDAPHFRILTNEKIEKIHQATLSCLERTGVEVLNPEGVNLLKSAGARVDGTRVRIPANIIENALETTPESFTLYGEEERFNIRVAGGRPLFGPGPTCTWFSDPETGERRVTRRGDPAITARVCDALDHIDYVMSLGLIDNVTSTLASVYEFAEMITNTRKPVLAWAYDLDSLKDIHRIGRVVAGGEEKMRLEPRFAFFSNSHPPLCHTDNDLANSLWAVEKGIPLFYLGGGVTGLIAPVTGAGLLVCSLACLLSGLAIFQLKKPGAPVCLGFVPASMDLRTARPLYGGPELSLYSAAYSDILRFLGIPFMGTAGASEAKTVDPQAAIESAIQVVLSSLSGADVVHDVGFLDCADLGSME
ncbi:MAG: trimethylamine methyltransferase, partial [Desulfobacterales bacterium]|nr:trimethylamine methyltransferase [Desulfobacterales bacterium]